MTVARLRRSLVMTLTMSLSAVLSPGCSQNHFIVVRNECSNDVAIRIVNVADPARSLPAYYPLPPGESFNWALEGFQPTDYSVEIVPPDSQPSVRAVAAVRSSSRDFVIKGEVCSKY